MISGLVAIVPLVFYVGNDWAIALLALTYGLLAQLPGALLVRGLRLMRQAIGNYRQAILPAWNGGQGWGESATRGVKRRCSYHMSTDRGNSLPYWT